MNQQYYTGYIHSKSEQAQSHGQVQFGSGHVQSGREKAQSSSTSMAVQMLKNKNKPKEEIKTVDKERQKIELEKSLESNRSFNCVNEEVKESYDKRDAKLKQREEDMRESLRKTEAKYYPDFDKDLGSDKDKDLGSDKDKDLGSDKDKDVDSDKDKDSDLDTDSSDDFFYIQKPKTNGF